MRWDRFFADLEDQLDAEWEAERALLDTEAERARIARLSLRDRVLALPRGSALTLEAGDEVTASGVLLGAGADVIAIDPGTRREGPIVIPIGAVTGVDFPADAVLSSLRPARRSALAERLTFGFVMRDLARSRTTVVIETGTRELAGTIDRAGSDHLDLALHDRSEPRRQSAVSSVRLVAFGAIRCVRADAPVVLP